MHLLTSVLLAIQVISSLSIIVLVLLQQGKGADMGSSFGSGSAGSLFGASGAANFLSRTTKWAAVIFFASTIGLAYTSHHTTNSILDGGIMQGFQSQPEAPAKVAPQGSAVPTVPGTPAPAAPAANGAAANSAGSVPSVGQQPADKASVPAAPAAESKASVPSAPAKTDGAKPADKPAEK
ncbi:preprotein translocase subunit SecG [Eoetvoesiella caeni]|uniref:Protein-export membrane protein SecG n=1 Tax=Eoetvoesiella caeni TaxID=645616 RepID=A0A366HM63_9BURK|nr:preprotein translocase subunit SecG [Eoetvoesiella caeni]MCI2807053.1 preprotein translocase subunit SecG [Eoetvoesiella caeni]NYT53550.1 preprotein translocase subunit SecG [Eoetvoesiella caeni]RBP43536.1 protein translocase subunit secG [Eoetvoesiella caeni]